MLIKFSNSTTRSNTDTYRNKKKNQLLQKLSLRLWFWLSWYKVIKELIHGWRNISLPFSSCFEVYKVCIIQVFGGYLKLFWVLPHFFHFFVDWFIRWWFRFGGFVSTLFHKPLKFCWFKLKNSSGSYEIRVYAFLENREKSETSLEICG
jgi:hypothetical protein